ncbi:hypothetical protein Bpfe_012709 [Biomphalaria pfeifferi]|uniref:Prokineticin domain-containing protein n=1 Tax=Biomphalaria pfeifferi TaxID=112525 RepID=A0AAD8FBH7_BIOPF|nr:hypothetical protein Bpfe_012709 [Biomphalaria pfeifferi]
MASRWTLQHSLVISLVLWLGLHKVHTNQDVIEMNCVPTIRHKFDVCPTGYCCVRDEFLATYVYCKKIGAQDDNCTTRDTESSCPCGAGLYCKANIVGTFPSVYGKCEVSPNVTSTPSVVG